jgi:hypothetical protein
MDGAAEKRTKKEMDPAMRGPSCSLNLAYVLRSSTPRAVRTRRTRAKMILAANSLPSGGLRRQASPYTIEEIAVRTIRIRREAR